LKIYSLKVKQVIRETSEAITIKFENASEPISYKSGQFITLILDIDGKEVRRSYSLNSAPAIDQDLSVSVKAVSNGLVSNLLNQKTKAGDVLKVIEPMGNFYFEPKADLKRHIILVGAGSGITPLFSILKSVLHKEPQSKVSLIYGNRTKESIIYHQELDDLKKKFEDRLNLVHVLSRPDENWTGLTGRINESLVTSLIEKLAPINHKEALYFMCGPKGLMEETVKSLELLQVPKTNIHRESFGADSTGAAPIPSSSPKGKSKVTIIEGKKKYEFEVDPKDTILETALKLGHNLPYSCQSGMCTACMGKCTSGKVHMENADGLTENEIKNGYVLTCIGHPASEEVVIQL
jgi:ring-1,2-phenylacetyl-CoA epoxidase subunit PaaE